MNIYGPLVRIALRYGAGALFSVSVGDMLASDPDLVNIGVALLSGAVSAVTERFYVLARKKGGAL